MPETEVGAETIVFVWKQAHPYFKVQYGCVVRLSGACPECEEMKFTMTVKG